MRHYKYLTKDGKPVWVCEACKRAKMDMILLGAWKLIDRKDESSACEHCAQGTGQENVS